MHRALAMLMVTVTAATTRAADPPPPVRPDVLVLLTDDQQWDAIGALGNDHVRTPHLDRLVAEGFTLTRTYCMGSWSGAVCRPSRAMLLTGRTLWQVNGDLAGHVTWPEVMRGHGYVTFGTGKWHNGKAAFARGFTDGGHVFFGGMSDHDRVPVQPFDPSGVYPAETRAAGAKFSSELFADDVIAFLARAPADRPFFAYVSFTAPHDPRMAPEPWASAIDPAALPLPASFAPAHPFDNGELRIRDELLAPFPRTPDVVREHLAAYYAMIAHLDHHIGRILGALERSGRAERTIIVFASDHGLAVGRHGLLGKQNMYEHSVRAPLVFRGPGVPRGGRSDTLTYLLDVFPTVLDLAGLPVPPEVEGTSLGPVIAGRPATGRPEIVCAYKNVQRMVTGPRYKLVEYRVGDRRTLQLFDLEEDPHETVNLADAPGHAERRRRLEGRLAPWWALGDPAPDRRKP